MEKKEIRLQWRGRFLLWHLFMYGNIPSEYFYLICRKRRFSPVEILYIGETETTVKVRTLDYKHDQLDKIIEEDTSHKLIKSFIKELVKRYPGFEIFDNSILLEGIRMRRIVFFLGRFKVSLNLPKITEKLIKGVECALIFHCRNIRKECKRNTACTKTYNLEKYDHLKITNEPYYFYLRLKNLHPLANVIDTTKFPEKNLRF